MKKAFTLIELLVVVLIIGILAAVAVPQYQKAVEKSKATQAMTLLKTVVQAMESYYMANGSYPMQFSQMDIDISWTEGTKLWNNTTDAKSDAEWNILLQNANECNNLHILRRNGKYQGTGFAWIFETNTTIPKNKLLCLEQTDSSNNLSAGTYCVKLFQGTQDGTGGHARYYTLP